jgi:hypothetical protein
MATPHPNEFDLRAEQLSMQGRLLAVHCRCGWRGIQSQLETEGTRKDRLCPACGATFKRLSLERE